jgi:hypothetical protein
MKKPKNYLQVRTPLLTMVCLYNLLYDSDELQMEDSNNFVLFKKELGNRVNFYANNICDDSFNAIVIDCSSFIFNEIGYDYHAYLHLLNDILNIIDGPKEKKLQYYLKTIVKKLELNQNDEVVYISKNIYERINKQFVYLKK